MLHRHLFQVEQQLRQHGEVAIKRADELQDTMTGTEQLLPIKLSAEPLNEGLPRLVETATHSRHWYISADRQLPGKVDIEAVAADEL